MPLAGTTGDFLEAESVCGPQASRGALRPARHQKATARDRVARDVCRRCSPQGQHQAASRGDGRRRGVTALYRDRASSRLSIHRVRCRPGWWRRRPRKRVSHQRHRCGFRAAGERPVLARSAERRSWPRGRIRNTAGVGGAGTRGRSSGRVRHGRTRHRQDVARQRPVAAGFRCCARVDRQGAVPGTVRRRRSVPACARRLVPTRPCAWRRPHH